MIRTSQTGFICAKTKTKTRVDNNPTFGKLITIKKRVRLNGPQYLSTFSGIQMFEAVKERVEEFLHPTHEEVEHDPELYTKIADRVSKMYVKVLDHDTIKAIVSFCYDETFYMTGIRIIKGNDGRPDFVSYPARKTPQGEYKNHYFPANPEVRSAISEVILKAVNERIIDYQQGKPLRTE